MAKRGENKFSDTEGVPARLSVEDARSGLGLRPEPSPWSFQHRGGTIVMILLIAVLLAGAWYDMYGHR